MFLLQLGQEEVVAPFDNEGRYNSTLLDNMGVIYSNQSDIAFWNNGYSETNNCPWGGIHNGLDYFYYNNSVVIAAAPGKVQEIEVGYLPPPYDNIYVVGVQIKFNDSITTAYAFEGDSNNSVVRSQQELMLDVEAGDWVAKGEQIGRFLRPTEYAHIHFSVYHNDQGICPRLVMGETDYNEIMSLVLAFHSDWELCYH